MVQTLRIVLVGLVIGFPVTLVGCGDQPAVEYEVTKKPKHPLIGKSVLQLKFQGIRNQDGQPVDSSRFQQRVTVLSFLYTDCPYEKMCPRLTEKLRSVQTMFPADNKNAQIVVVTLDPKNDSPKVLREYGKDYNVNFGSWSFWNVPGDVLNRWLEELLMVAEKQDGTINHNMQTFVIDREGTIREIFTGADWSPGEVTKIVQDTLASSP